MMVRPNVSSGGDRLSADGFRETYQMGRTASYTPLHARHVIDPVRHVRRSVGVQADESNYSGSVVVVRLSPNVFWDGGGIEAR